MIALNATSNLPEVAQQLRDAADGIPDRLEQAVEAVSRYLQDALQDTAPVSKPVPGGRAPGTLRKSIRFDLEGLTAEFMAASYAGFVIGGTGPHVIHGNPLLHFWWDKKGGFVTFHSVRHPGTRPNDFRQPALERASDQADDELEALADWLAELVA